jgi:zinc transporter
LRLCQDWSRPHFNLAEARACRFLKGGFSLPVAARELLVSADEHQQLNVSGGCLYGVFADVICDLDGLTEEIGFLHFALAASRHRAPALVERGERDA